MPRRSWRVVSACEIGTSHVRSGLPCQDSVAHSIVRTKRGNVFISVVSDGAGSAAHSDIGSWLATTTFVELVEVYLEAGGRLIDIDRQRVVSWVEATTARLIERARDDGKMVERLMRWRRSVEAKFVFDPTKAIDPRDIIKVEQEIQTLRLKAEAAAKSAHIETLQTHARILGIRHSNRQQMDAFQIAVAQAKADLDFVRG